MTSLLRALTFFRWSSLYSLIISSISSSDIPVFPFNNFLKSSSNRKPLPSGSRLLQIRATIYKIEITMSNLNICSREFSSGSLILSLETIFRYSLKQTEKPDVSRETVPANSIAWGQQIVDNFDEFWNGTWSQLRIIPRHLVIPWNSFKLRTPSLSLSNN